MCRNRWLQTWNGNGWTLTGQDIHGVLIKEATSKGFAEAVPGDSINIMFPGSNTRRGRVQHQRAGTIKTSCNQGVLVAAGEALSIGNKIRPNDEISITIKSNGDLRPHKNDKRKSGLSEFVINNENNCSNTCIASHQVSVYGESTNYRIRKLTPREYWRLQGFPDELFDKAAQVNSKTQLYKQAGNAVTVNVVEQIGKNIPV